LPVDETHLVEPTDVNGINKAAGEYYHLVYNNVFGVRACSLRLTNVYGPRQLIKHNRQGFIGWFIRLAVENQTIQIYGDGSQLRDFVYVDDAADAFLRAGASDACNGEVFNVGGDRPISHRELTTLLVDRAGSGAVRYVEWPAEQKAIDIGSFYADSSKFMRTTGWTPAVALGDGLARTVAFYREHLHHYIGPEYVAPAEGVESA
jgi:UDP-glucose 4-epimerase